MKPSTLKDCIATLQKLRNAYESQLDARVVSELDEVIAELVKVRDGGQGSERLVVLSVRALELIDHIIRLVTNITEMMK